MSGVVLMRKPIGILAGILGLVQGLVWTILALLGILTYNCVLEVPVNPDHARSDIFLQVLLSLYFQGPDCTNVPVIPTTAIDAVLTPADVQIWVIVYLVFNFIWIVSSIYLLIDLSRGDRPPISTYIWIGVTSLNMILDLACCIRFGLDFDTIKQWVDVASNAPLDSTALLTAPALLMTLAARGYVLWIVNDVLVTFLITSVLREIKEKKQNNDKNLSRRTSFTNPTLNAMWPDSTERRTSDLYQQPIRSKNNWDPPTPTDTPTYPYSYSRPMSPTSSVPAGYNMYNELSSRTAAPAPPLILSDPPRGQYASSPRHIPSPDYSPPLNHKPMLPLRPALRKPPGQIGHIGRTVF